MPVPTLSNDLRVRDRRGAVQVDAVAGVAVDRQPVERGRRGAVLGIADVAVVEERRTVGLTGVPLGPLIVPAPEAYRPLRLS